MGGMKKRELEMPADKFDALGPLLSDVGGEIAKVVGGNPDGAYLYVEAGEGWIGSAGSYVILIQVSSWTNCFWSFGAPKSRTSAGP